MTYCFKCPKCGYRVEQNVAHPAPTHFHSWMPNASKFPQPAREVLMVRDWQAEAVNMNTEGLH